MKLKIIYILLLLLIFRGTADAQEYIGHAEAFQTVHIHPEISARIIRVNFTEGSFVKEGVILFTLNSAQFQASV